MKNNMFVKDQGKNPMIDCVVKIEENSEVSQSAAVFIIYR